MTGGFLVLHAAKISTNYCQKVYLLTVALVCVMILEKRQNRKTLPFFLLIMANKNPQFCAF